MIQFKCCYHNPYNTLVLLQIHLHTYVEKGLTRKIVFCLLLVKNKQTKLKGGIKITVIKNLNLKLKCFKDNLCFTASR